MARFPFSGVSGQGDGMRRINPAVSGGDDPSAGVGLHPLVRYPAESRFVRFFDRRRQYRL